MTSLNSLTAVVWVVTAAKQRLKAKGNIKAKDCFTYNHAAGMILLLDCELFLLFVAEITLRALAPLTCNNSKL